MRIWLNRGFIYDTPYFLANGSFPINRDACNLYEIASIPRNDMIIKDSGINQKKYSSRREEMWGEGPPGPPGVIAWIWLRTSTEAEDQNRSTPNHPEEPPQTTQTLAILMSD